MTRAVRLPGVDTAKRRHCRMDQDHNRLVIDVADALTLNQGH